MRVLTFMSLGESTSEVSFDDLCKELNIGTEEIEDFIIEGLFHCFSMFVFIRAGWRKSDRSIDGEPQGNWRWNSNSRDIVAYSPSFFPSKPAPFYTSYFTGPV